MEVFTVSRKTPKASVIVPVFNGEKYLEDALRSITTQTFEDFELIVHDDASTDRSSEIVRDLGDPRIVLIRTEEREGISAGLNRCITMARSDLVFRMDADDIALPHRMERQVAFMQANPDVGVCGSWYEVFSDTEAGRIVQTAATHDHLKFITLLQTPFGHPTVVLRKSVLLRYGQFYGTQRIAEDYDLWSRLVNRTRFANIQEVLLRYRSNPAGGTQSRMPKIMAAIHDIQIDQFLQLIPNATKSEQNAYLQLLFKTYQLTPDFGFLIHDLIQRLIESNCNGKKYLPEHFDNFFLDRWRMVSDAMAAAGHSGFRESPLSRRLAPITLS